MNDEKSTAAIFKLPNGSEFKIGSVLEHPRGLHFTVEAVIDQDGTEALVLLSPSIPDPEDPNTAQGDMLSQMGDWKVARYSEAKPH